MNKIVFILLLSIMSNVVAFAQKELSQEELDNLDKALSMKDVYDSNKITHIDSLRSVLIEFQGDKHARCSMTCDIAKQYEKFMSDSALAYYDKASLLAGELQDTTLMLRSKFGKIKVLGIMGFFKEGVAELDSIEKRGVPAELKGMWLDCGRQLYSYIVVYTMQGNSKHVDNYLLEYANRLNFYREEQIKLLEQGSLEYNLFLGEHIYDTQPRRAKQLFAEVMANVPMDNNLYARASANMAAIKDNEDNLDEAAYYLALSAISDIKSSVKENTSLQKLAVYLYDKGDINHAYSYISASLSDAVFCNARLRMSEISNIIPLIDGAYKMQLEKKHKLLLFTTLVVTLLTLSLVVAVIFVLKQMRKLNLIRQSLKEANKIKEEYMGHFLDLCSIYMERLDNFCKVVTRKLTAGQVDDLIKMTKSSKFAEEQHKQFYENFDGVFLHIYPTFIEDFNKLLLPEDRITIKDPGRLTTELRIFAFLRMGVEDSNKIANFLHYSVNTIYAYRNKVKNKAIDREHFEENIMKIGSIQ